MKKLIFATLAAMFLMGATLVVTFQEELFVSSSDGTTTQLHIERHPNQASNLFEITYGTGKHKRNWFIVNSDGDVAMGPGFNRSGSANSHQILSMESRWPNRYPLIELNGRNRTQGVYETIGQIMWSYQNDLGEWNVVGFLEMMEDESGDEGAAYGFYCKAHDDEKTSLCLYIAGNGELRIRDGERTMLPVTFGPDDSCGTGFRCMKIPN